MGRTRGERAISLFLATQMLCAPLGTTALAASHSEPTLKGAGLTPSVLENMDPATNAAGKSDVSKRPEGSSGEETLPAEGSPTEQEKDQPPGTDVPEPVDSSAALPPPEAAPPEKESPPEPMASTGDDVPTEPTVSTEDDILTDPTVTMPVIKPEEPLVPGVTTGLDTELDPDTLPAAGTDTQPGTNVEPEAETDVAMLPQEAQVQAANEIALFDARGIAEDETPFRWLILGYGYTLDYDFETDSTSHKPYYAGTKRAAQSDRADGEPWVMTRTDVGVAVEVDPDHHTKKMDFRANSIHSFEWEPQSDGKYYFADLIVLGHDGGQIPWPGTLSDKPITGTDSSGSYSYPPIQEYLGRIPDYTFDGWYIYGGGWYDGSQGEENYSKLTPQDVRPPAPSTFDVKIDLTRGYTLPELRSLLWTEEKHNNSDNAIKASTQYLYPYYAHGNQKLQDLPIIAHWKLSSDATLVDKSVSKKPGEPVEEFTAIRGYDAEGNPVSGAENLLQGNSRLYLDDPNVSTNPTVATNFDPTKTEYYIQVQPNVAAIDLSLLATEGFRADQGLPEAAGVTVKVNGAEAATSLVGTTLNDKVVSTDSNNITKTTFYNSCLYPMRSRWVLPEGQKIELEPSSGDAHYTDIEVTVTAPDGVTTETYTFHIQRLNTPRMILNPGNTPFGMIARDSGLDDTAKQAAREAYLEDSSYRLRNGSDILTTGSENNNGHIYDGTYYDSAWSGYTNVWAEDMADYIGNNVDLDETAIVVYQDSSFKDPGFTIIDSRGEQVTSGKTYRSVVLRVATNETTGLTTDALVSDTADSTNVTNCYYDVSAKTMKTVGVDNPESGILQARFQLVTNPDGTDQIDLRGARVIPGIYQIEYAFEDALSQKVYTCDPDLFEVNPESAVTFRRTLVVLPRPGDIDMDGAVTAADAELLRRAIAFKGGTVPPNSLEKEPFLTYTTAGAELFASRVCDVNGDGEVDAGDVEKIQGGFTPVITDSQCDYFYLPLETGLSAEEEANWHVRRDAVYTSADDALSHIDQKASVSLEFLGLNSDAITADPTELDAISSEGAQVRLNDVFWVGVKVTNLDQIRAASATAPVANRKAICGGISSIGLTIAYDGTYLEPAAVGTDATGEQAWLDTVTKYNIGNSVGNTDLNWWDGGYAVIADGTKYDKDYTEHYSQPILEAESAFKGIKTMTVLLGTTGTHYRTLNDPRTEAGKDYYLLRVPFKLKSFPYDKTELNALDLGLGMKQMTLFSRVIPDAQDVPTVAAVWSSQDEIYGGATRNLAEELFYVDGSARHIPLGKNTSEIIDLRNSAAGHDNGKIVYGETCKIVESRLTGHQKDINDALATLGLECDNVGTIASIDGKGPTAVGELILPVSNRDGSVTRYRITVEKAELTLYPTAQTRYYGEADSLDYTYRTEDIKDRDLSKLDNNGSSTELKKLEGYKEPKLTTDADQNSPAEGDYTITLRDEKDVDGNVISGLENYKFVYASEGSTETGDQATAKLTIRKRPVKVGEITAAGMSSVFVFVNPDQTVFKNVAAELKENHFTVEAMTEYDGLPLSNGAVYGDDELKLTFTATLNRDDCSSVPAGDMEKTVEATIEDLALTTECATNYVLVSTKPVKKTAPSKVLNNPVIELQVNKVPADADLNTVEYENGTKYDYSGLTVNLITMDGKPVIAENAFVYDGSDLFERYGIHITYEPNTTDAPDWENHKLESGTTLLAEVHDKMYLCVSVSGYAEDENGDWVPKTLSWYSEKPFRILKNVLTLRPEPLDIYYGEYDSTKMLTYTYDPSELTPADQAWLKTALGKTELDGTPEELEKLGTKSGGSKYVAPKLIGIESREKPDAELKKNTPVDARDESVYVVKLSHAKDVNDVILDGLPNYDFMFANAGATTGRNSEAGYARVRIYPRPIVVDKVTMSVDTTDDGKGKAYLYDDTTNWVLKQMNLTDTNTGTRTKQYVTVANADNGPDSFKAVQPEKNVYFIPGVDYEQPLRALENTDVILPDDKVVLRYTATYHRDVENGDPLNGRPYFTLGDDLTALKDVTISGLELAPSGADNSNRNYVLVYDRRTDASQSYPKDQTAQGLVKMRGLTSLRIAPSSYRREYTYGEELALKGLQVFLEYDAEGDNDPQANGRIIQRSLGYEWSTAQGTSNFAQQGGLQVYLVDPRVDLTDLGELTEEQLASRLGQPVNTGNYLDVAQTGKRLVICGRRNDQQALRWAAASDSFTIAKKVLPLTVEQKHRYYGEPNGIYSASVLLADLAKPDREKLTAEGYTEKDLRLTATKDNTVVDNRYETTGVATSTALRFLDPTMTGPRFTTTATQGVSHGVYAVEMDIAGAEMANYRFDKTQITSGSIQVFRRPIVVSKICLEPIVTIYNNTVDTDFSASASQVGQKRDGDTSYKDDPDNPTPQGILTQKPQLGANGIYEYPESGVIEQEYLNAVNSGMNPHEASLTLTGDAIYGDDAIRVGLTAVFPASGSRTPNPGPGTTYMWPEPKVTVRDVVLTTWGDGDNYFIVTDPGQNEGEPVNKQATGRLDIRPIKKIEIIAEPTMTYTYGEPLDLSDLRVRVTYEQLTDYPEYSPDEVVKANNGKLSINYWDPAEDVEQLKDPANYAMGVDKPKAATGDHLTRAPDHITGLGLVHNGKYLLISARTDTSVKYTAEPQFVSANGKPLGLTVNRKKLTYTFTAEDRVYDTTDKAEGSVQLTNVYETQNDRDLIFVATGADYETADPATGKYTALETHIKGDGVSAGKGYTFESREDTRDQGLTFNFFDPNVKYADERHSTASPVAAEGWLAYWNSLSGTERAVKTAGSAGWDTYADKQVASQPVLVSGMTLGGPDAENYELAPAVDLDHEPECVPYATISKAEQTIDSGEKPKLTVNSAANTVRVNYTTDVAAERVSEDDYAAELHYEYALDHMGGNGLERWSWYENEEETQSVQWSDSYYFGGEKLDAYVPSDYRPSEEKPSGDDKIVKGQAYGWSENGGSWYNAADTGLGSRKPLDRDTVYWGAIRLAETHNYKASEEVHSSADKDDTSALTAESGGAKSAADSVSRTVLSWVDNQLTEESNRDPSPAPAAAVKTYQERIALYSSTDETTGSGQQIAVDTLEAVWFTDILQYEKKETMDAVTRNQSPTRYYGYYWDRDHSAELKFDEGGLSLAGQLSVEIDQRQSDGSTVKKNVDVNVDHNADLYVSTGGGGSWAMHAHRIVIVPDSVTAVLGDAPIKLKVELRPQGSLWEAFLWSSSNENVVRVNENGKLYFVGVGTATITAVGRQSKVTASIRVTVTDPKGQQQGIGVVNEAILALAQSPDNRFNFYYDGAYMPLGKDYRFYPERVMDRAELATVLGRFYLHESWTWDGKVNFQDLTGEESYAEAVELLCRGGILTGLPGGIFGGDRTATRAEMAAILCRMMGLKPVNTAGQAHAFIDAGETDTWAYAYIDALAAAGVVNGTGDGCYNPQRAITRAEAAAMLGRMILSGADYGETPVVPKDVSEGHWAYCLILRAVNRVILPQNYQVLISKED